MKIVNGFVWKIITSEQAKAMFGYIELYELHENGAESLIEDIENLLLRLKQGIVIGIEVGHIDENSARDCLESKGYFVYNLWSVEDVKGVFKCTDEQAQYILNKSLTNDATMEQIWFSIKEFGKYQGLEEMM